MAAAPQPPVDENFLMKVFQQVDKDHSNAINATELQSCLSNGTWEPFNAETVKLMITIFDRSHKGQLNFEEFKQLWKYIEDWRQCFQSFDKDKSGYINKEELKMALTTFGYQLSDSFYDLLFTKFIKGGQSKCSASFRTLRGRASLHVMPLNPSLPLINPKLNHLLAFNYKQFLCTSR